MSQMLYLLPASDERMKLRAAQRRQSIHEFLLDALDVQFSPDGEPPLQRYSEPRPAKGGAVPGAPHLSPVPGPPLGGAAARSGGGRGVSGETPRPPPPRPYVATRGGGRESPRGDDGRRPRATGGGAGDLDVSGYLPAAGKRGGPHLLYLPTRSAASARERLRMFDAVGEAAGAREGLAFATA